MDFWAQHKDFILKVLAGVGVFLVALIARSITYGDELENAQRRNRDLVSDIASKPVPQMARIVELEGDSKLLEENAKAIAEQIGWNLGNERLPQILLERILRTTRSYGRMSETDLVRAAEVFRGAIKDNLNGGFGQLRLTIRKELFDEASERNIRIPEGIGFENVISLEPDEVWQYLLQLDLVARFARYAIDAKVDHVSEILIDTGKRQEVIPGAHPAFIEEYPVRVTFTGSQAAVRAVFNRLEQETPRPALRGLRITRETRPANHLTLTMTLLATASNPSNPDVPFKEK